MVEDSYSYARPNRRYSDPILPGMIGREGLEQLVFAADISGSITDQQILRFFSEGKFIHEELRPEAMTLVTFDTKVQDVFHLEREDPYDTFVIHGRGGTDLEDLYKFAGKENATALVVFTDLYVDIPPNPDIPIIWIVVDNPSAKVPYGTLIHLSE
jgi:predicted metal-dependent peptidase